LQIGCERSAGDNWFGAHEFAIAQLNSRNEKVVIGGKKIRPHRETKMTSWPLTGPCPKACWLGFLLMLFRTELFAVQFGENVGDKLQIGRAAAARIEGQV
jgi:hypothetical protein